MSSTAYYSRIWFDHQVWHGDDECSEGSRILEQNRVSGTGGLKPCRECGRVKKRAMTRLDDRSGSARS
jgi:hypothetical protein